MDKIVVVGTGDYYHRFLAPTIKELKEQGAVDLIATIDTKPRIFQEKDLFPEIKHIIRNPSQNLSEIVDVFGKDVIVILGHANQEHLPDLKDLVQNGQRVMVEKPYAINSQQLEQLKQLVSEHPNKIFFLEYYLKRKISPLIALAGKIKEDSFYFEGEKVFRANEHFPNKNLSGQITKFIGDPLSVSVDILESEGDSGKLDHRGPHLIKINTGGGMIQDLGIHAVASLFGLQEVIGEINKDFGNGNVKLAQCREFVNSMTKIHDLKDEEVAETYAQFNFKTSKDIPVSIRVGKYIANLPTQKRMILEGTRGKFIMDLHENKLFYKRNGDNEKLLLELTNVKESRYYPVILAGLEFFKGTNIFNFDPIKIPLDAQEFILNLLDKSRNLNAIKYYDKNTPYTEIFNQEELEGTLSSLPRENLKEYYQKYTQYLSEMLSSVDQSQLDEIANIFLEARKNGNTIYFVGNGGSAATASHFAQDLAEVGRKVGVKVFNSISLTDNVAGITAAANDHGYNKIFSFQMQGHFKKGDVLVAISASGNSENIIEAARFAKERGGIVIGLVGFEGGKLAKLSDYVVHAKSFKGEYGPVEDVHMIFDHLITSYFYYKLKDELN